MLLAQVIEKNGSISYKNVNLLNATIISFEPDDSGREGSAITESLGMRRFRVYKTSAGEIVCTMQRLKNSSKRESYIINDKLPKNVKDALNFENFLETKEKRR
jgi:hypothetical protein